MASPFTPEELLYLKAHKNDSRIPEIIWAYSVPIVAGVVSTSLRLWAKRYGRNGITLDDYLIIFATLCLIGQCSAGLAYGPPHGMGRHVNAVSAYDQMMVKQGDFIFSHFYDFALASVKLGILAFYYRLFILPSFRKIILGTAAFVLAWIIGITVTLFLACRPLARYWDNRLDGKCLVMVNFTYFTNITNLVTDLWIFMMPIPMIWHLQLQTKRKLLLSLIFCIGLATCIVSSLRLKVVLRRSSPDFTWFYVPLGMYSVYEPLGGILCTNLPIIWNLVRRRRAAHSAELGFKNECHSHVAPTMSSKRQRFAIRLGITSLLRSKPCTEATTPSGTATHMCAPSAASRESVHRETLADARIWPTVEKLGSQVKVKEQQEEERGAPMTPGMKRTVWNVRQ